MKKHLLLLTTAVLFSVASAFAQGGTTGPLTWEINSGTLTISGTGAMPNYGYWDNQAPWYDYRESITSIVIESGVLTIGNYAFAGCSAFTSTNIPDGILFIGENAFSSCSNLVLITLPNSVTTIGDAIFAGCSNLTLVTLPSGITSTGNYTFQSCTSLTSITLPISITTIGDGAFSDCGSLASITIPSNVTTIGESAFSGCSSLASITIPNGVTTIGNNVFRGSYNLTSINVESGNVNYSSENGVLFNKDKTTLICCPQGKTGSYTIPNGVTTIEISALYGCRFTSITIPNSVTTIEQSAFSGCYNLTSIAIPSSVISIGERVFIDCNNLTSINVESANANYSSENGVLFNKDKTMLIFCLQGKTGSYTIPSSVITIENEAFYYCRNLTSVTIPNSVATIGQYAFSGCESLASITISNSVTTIGQYAFSSCYNLTSITIPNSITTIENFTFSGCYTLTSIIIPNGVTTTGYGAFSWCKALVSITFPSSVTSIGDFYFYEGCSLTSITNLNPIPVNLDYYYFYGVDRSACTLKVPTSAVSTYKNAEVWKEFNIVGGGFLVNPKPGNNEHGYATGNELYPANATATVTATAYTDYKFVNWTKNGEIVSTNNPYSFTVTEDVELVANFEKGVGIENIEIAAVKIYPNPTTGELILNLIQDKNGELKIKSVEVFDIYGRALLSFVSLMSPKTTIDISHLSTGVYFLRIRTEQGEVVRKVVKE